MKKFSIDCPVPIDQQPMNEYTELKKSTFFLWTTKDSNTYTKTVILLTLTAYFFVFMLILGSTPKSSSLDFLNTCPYVTIFGNLIINLYFARIYLGWNYIYNRLLKASVSYEESGWYDGQTWIKTPNILLQDKLVAEYQIYPVLNRVKITIVILFSTGILSYLYLILKK